MKLVEARENFNKLLNSIDKDDLGSFLRHVHSRSEDMLHTLEPANNEVLIQSIQDDLREMVPLEATLSSEEVLSPTFGENSDCDPQTTLHVDAFLYEEQAIDDLCDEGVMSRNYCTKCGSKNVVPLTFISHSTSLSQAQYIYQHALPDLHNSVVIDVGSRLGALLYAGYYFSDASKIIGVEINSEWCEVQQKIVEKYHLQDRIQIINDDIITQGNLLGKADVVILNNVFEFFVPVDSQTRIWCFLRSTLRKKGTMLVVSPSLEKSIKHLQTGIELSSWVHSVDSSKMLAAANLHLFGMENHEDSDLTDIHFYRVL